MYKDIKIMLGILIVMGVVNTYYSYKNKKRIDQLQFLVSGNRNSGSQGSAQVLQNQVRITQNQAVGAASHTYFELLLEGLARKQGLPLERARAAFDEEVKGARRPPNWKWMEDWAK